VFEFELQALDSYLARKMYSDSDVFILDACAPPCG